MRADMCPCSVTTVTKPDSGPSCGSWFADEYSAWHSDCPDTSKPNSSRGNGAARLVRRREAGDQHSRLLGWPADLALPRGGVTARGIRTPDLLIAKPTEGLPEPAPRRPIATSPRDEDSGETG